MEKLGILSEKEGEFSAACDHYVQAEDVSMLIETARKDEAHLKNLRDRIMACHSGIGELPKEKE